MADRIKIAGLVTLHNWQRVRRSVGAPLRLLAMAAARGPDRLLIAPQDLRTSDPQIATDMYGGIFTFAGKTVEAAGSPFDAPPPSDGWTRTLMGFSWLRHLRAADTALARANARTLVQDWVLRVDRGRARHRGNIAFEPSVVVRRLLSWLSQSPLILEGADHAFYRQFMASLNRQAAYLQRCLSEGVAGATRLHIGIALAELALCTGRPAVHQRKASRFLEAELASQILPDGGHISRNPKAIVDLLLDLLPLRQAYLAQGVESPAQLRNAIDRMMPMLRMFRHGDGTLALFNGMGVTAPDVLATLLAYDDALSGVSLNAPHSAYRRVEVGRGVVLFDVGTPPPTAFSSDAHASCLAFEFSHEAQKIFCNCGAPDPSRTALVAAARATAAHSTLVVADTSSCSFATPSKLRPWLDQIVAGPARVAIERMDTDESIDITARHDGYAKRFGLVHERRLGLGDQGRKLFGRDTLAPAGKRAPKAADYALRFHLHPALKASGSKEGLAAILACPGGEAWVFEANGLPVELEESVYFAGPDGPRRTMQIVVRGRSDATPVVNWSLQLGDGRQKAQRRRKGDPELF